ncbi:MAG: hypothetical protein ABIS45_14880 [Burkholderiales bacterium]
MDVLVLNIIVRSAICTALLSALFACSDKDSSSQKPVPENLARLNGLPYGPLPNTVDIKLGVGRPGLFGDRMQFATVLEDGQGNIVAQGPLTVEVSRMYRDGQELHSAGTGFDTFIFGSVKEMRVGGVRKFDLRMPKEYPQICAVIQGKCRIPIGKDWAVVTPNETYTLQVTLETICTPHYALKKNWGIPPGLNPTLVESGC